MDIDPGTDTTTRLGGKSLHRKQRNIAEQFAGCPGEGSRDDISSDILNCVLLPCPERNWINIELSSNPSPTGLSDWLVMITVLSQNLIHRLYYFFPQLPLTHRPQSCEKFWLNCPLSLPSLLLLPHLGRSHDTGEARSGNGDTESRSWGWVTFVGRRKYCSE